MVKDNEKLEREGDERRQNYQEWQFHSVESRSFAGEKVLRISRQVR